MKRFLRDQRARGFVLAWAVITAMLPPVAMASPVSGDSARNVLARFVGPGGLRTTVTMLDRAHYERTVVSAATTREDAGSGAIRYLGRFDNWHVHSAIRDGQVELWQARAETGSRSAPPGPTVMHTRLTPPGNHNRLVLVPPWWPPMRHPWVSRATGADGQLTTLLGWLPGSVSAVRRQLHRSARDGGLVLRGRVPVATNHPRGGELLFFAAARRELMVTLTPPSNATAWVGVVAHYRLGNR